MHQDAPVLEKKQFSKLPSFKKTPPSAFEPRKSPALTNEHHLEKNLHFQVLLLLVFGGVPFFFVDSKGYIPR